MASFRQQDASDNSSTQTNKFMPTAECEKRENKRENPPKFESILYAEETTVVVVVYGGSIYLYRLSFSFLLYFYLNCAISDMVDTNGIQLSSESRGRV
jgi:hypothetical protein